MNTKEKLAAGTALAMFGVILMCFTSPSISTVGGIAVGVGLTLFLTNLKD